jgi:Protein of unknown function (DUF3987)
MNYIEAYKEYCASCTDAMREYHQFMAYSNISTLIGRRLYFDYGPFPLYANLYIILLGESGISRKSFAMNLGLRQVYNLHEALVLPTEFSTEGLQKILQAQPEGTLYLEEFNTLQRSMERDYNSSLRPFLTTLYDCPPDYKRSLSDSSKSTHIKAPYLGIVGCSTEEWLIERIQETDIAGGFLPRFLFVQGITKPPTFRIPPTPTRFARDELFSHLSEIDNHIAKISSHNGGLLYFTEDAKEFYYSWFDKIESSRTNLNIHVRPFIERLRPYCIKLSMIETVAALESTISLGSVKAACQQVDFLLAQLQIITSHIQTSRTGKHRAKILRFLEKQSPNWVLRNVCQKGTSLDSKKEFDPAIQTLLDMGDIEVNPSYKNNGSPKTGIAYRLLNHT